MRILGAGALRDAITLMFSTAVVIPLVKRVGASSIIGFLLIGVLLGRSGVNFIRGGHELHVMGEAGIIFFLFEMGLEITAAKVRSMSFDVFALGAAQYFGTAILVAGLAKLFMPALSAPTLLLLGGALGLSTSAFVLQLIKDKKQLSTRYGRACMGVLLFQDIAIVPLLVIIPLLSGGGGSVGSALALAGARSVLALTTIFVLGHGVLNRIFWLVAKSDSNEAFLSVTLVTVMLCAQITEGLGLSSTLGAFFGGMLLAETDYRHQVEAAISPFRGMLLGLFFITVGMQIDLGLLAAAWPVVLPLLGGLIALKASLVFGVCKAGGLPSTSSVLAACLLGPGGEFAFVALGLGSQLGLLSPNATSLLITTVALSMGTTPFMARVGDAMADRFRERRALPSETCASTQQSLNQEDQHMIKEMTSGGFIAVYGYGKVGSVLCGLMDEVGNFKYIAFEDNQAIVSKTQAEGLPIFSTDLCKKESLDEFNVGSAKLFVVAMDEITDEALEVVRRVRGFYPELPVMACAADDAQLAKLEAFGVRAVVPRIPTQADLIALPFGGAVFRQAGIPESTIDGLLENRRRKTWDGMPMMNRDMMAAFKMADTDGSGELDEDAMKSALKNLGKKYTEEEFASIFAKIDVDGNGMIDYEEFSKIRDLDYQS